jgi:hypothetical protein
MPTSGLPGTAPTTAPTTRPPVTQPSSTPGIAPTPDTRPPGAPLDGVVYLGRHAGDLAVFFTDARYRARHRLTHDATDPFMGFLVQAIPGDGATRWWSPFDFRGLDAPRPVPIVSLWPIVGPGGFVLDARHDTLYLALSVEHDPAAQPYPANLTDLIVQSRLAAGTSRVIWSVRTFPAQPSDLFGTPFPFQVFDDRYLVFRLASCFGCPPEAWGTVVLNLANGRNARRSDIGDLQVDPAAGVFTYRRLITPVSLACKPGPDVPCSTEGTRTVMKPGGPTITEPLP